MRPFYLIISICIYLFATLANGTKSDSDDSMSSKVSEFRSDFEPNILLKQAELIIFEELNIQNDISIHPKWNLTFLQIEITLKIQILIFLIMNFFTEDYESFIHPIIINFCLYYLYFCLFSGLLLYLKLKHINFNHKQFSVLTSNCNELNLEFKQWIIGPLLWIFEIFSLIQTEAETADTCKNLNFLSYFSPESLRIMTLISLFQMLTFIIFLCQRHRILLFLKK